MLALSLPLPPVPFDPPEPDPPEPEPLLPPEPEPPLPEPPEPEPLLPPEPEPPLPEPPAKPRAPRLAPVGTVIQRARKGEVHEITVLDDGFEYEGRLYKSLTAIADAITGTHWNGHLFFGLAKTRKKAGKSAKESGR